MRSPERPRRRAIAAAPAFSLSHTPQLAGRRTQRRDRPPSRAQKGRTPGVPSGVRHEGESGGARRPCAVPNGPPPRACRPRPEGVPGRQAGSAGGGRLDPSRLPWRRKRPARSSRLSLSSIVLVRAIWPPVLGSPVARGGGALGAPLPHARRLSDTSAPTPHRQSAPRGHRGTVRSPLAPWLHRRSGVV